MLKDRDDSGDDKSGCDQGQCENVYKNAEFFGHSERIKLFYSCEEGNEEMPIKGKRLNVYA